MRVELLGPLRLVGDDGEDRTPRGDQQRRLLATLATAYPRPVSVNALEDSLWGGPPPSGNALHALVSKLRRAVAPATIDSRPGGYALGGAVVRDIDEFDAFVRSGDFGSAEGLIRGVPFEDLDGDPLIAAERSRLVTAVRSVQQQRLERAVAGEGAAAAVSELESFVVADPLDERAWALLMQARWRSGQAAEALRVYQRAQRALAEQAGLMPGAELRALERAVLDGVEPPGMPAPPGTPATRRRGLPTRLGSFVGRQRQLAELAIELTAHRLVTVVGPGGTGKTTIAVEVAHRVAPDAVFVALADIADGEAVVATLGRALGLPDSEQTGLAEQTLSEDRLERIVAALGDRSTTLVLDNCEHVVDVAADVVQRLLLQCTELHVIATSRGSLGVPGEFVYPLPPLPTDEAVDLFVARAHDHAAAGALASEPAELLRELCERLDGLPLAIELAAARLRAMTLSELVHRLDDRFAVLTAGRRVGEPRQQTLRAVFDWSHALLDPSEQLVFRRMAVFVGGASAEGLERVVAITSGVAAAALVEPVLGVVDRLIDKSLVRATRTPAGMRYSMLQTLHEYAAERLGESGEREAILISHAQYFAERASGAVRGLLGEAQEEWLGWIGRERQNLDAARSTAIAREDAQLALDLVTPLGWYFYMSGELASGADAIADALACPGPTEPASRALALSLFGWLASNGSQMETAVAATTEARALAAAAGDAWVDELSANVNAMVLFFTGRVAAATGMVPELERIAVDSTDPWIGGITKLVLGEIAKLSGHLRRAESLFETAALELATVGDRFSHAIVITEAAEVAEQFGDYDTAAALLQRGLAMAEQVGFSGHPLGMRARLANVEILRGDLDTASAHHALLLDDVVAQGVPWLQVQSLVGMAAIARRQARFDDAEHHLAAAWSLPRTQAVPFLRSLVLVARGYLADQQHDAASALAAQVAGLETATRLGTVRFVAYSLEGCAGALALTSEHAGLAARLLGAADRLRRESGTPMPEAERFDVDRATERSRSALGGELYLVEFAAGAASDLDALVATVAALAD